MTLTNHLEDHDARSRASDVFFMDQDNDSQGHSWCSVLHDLRDDFMLDVGRNYDTYPLKTVHGRKHDELKTATHLYRIITVDWDLDPDLKT